MESSKASICLCAENAAQSRSRHRLGKRKWLTVGRPRPLEQFVLDVLLAFAGACIKGACPRIDVMTAAPSHLELIGSELAIRWPDGTEDYIPTEKLRAWSPSAETTGERDLLGKKIGGSSQKSYPGVTVRNWRMIGGYAVQFDFSDGHNTGLYTFEYLKKLGQEAASPEG
jgi:DUF971 family protein